MFECILSCFGLSVQQFCKFFVKLNRLHNNFKVKCTAF
ncbi:hypothetical protein F542_17870 [Bibersteinia trehalosi USDA-ARS-USMARC-188]|uniref:Uncharacterized protein n=3 Tax=Bibersteinia trehalosi TaxID=47735 RepID=W0R8H0_BIBTR|nr:hypothetical protein WQG_4090 [Bibersteinia trehalosi USDA-ARS-USMARC-192]AHG82502.1 hypothetical protein F542_17870 [Bibersteinia trehalosi USDA-ARS-USMARC-188]AHG84835.1 hypothetical protein F543_19740 [Bibersteinia trehalosi USDA-ARS-USMARC-189]AHG85678.1 hypothetical protein F544_4460 [Bibersteinia trehalosi USDA-ARS-USMARC-190]